MRRLFFFLLIVFVIAQACDDKINPDLKSATPVFNVDAWITNKNEKQTIQLTWSQDYLDNTSTPKGISGATVYIVDDVGVKFSFQEDVSKHLGEYVWTPTATEYLVIGKQYTLNVSYQGETFTARTKLNRTTSVDSISFSYKKAPNPSAKDEWRAEFWGRDPVGAGDAYWIRAWKNGVLLDKPSEINYAYDAGISPGANNDGVTFLPPIRQAVNPNPADKDSKGDAIPAYLSGDSVYVEVRSISHEAYNYLLQVIDQTDRQGGIAELFSKPLDNVSTNITNTNATGTTVVGFFCVSAASGNGKRLKLK